MSFAEFLAMGGYGQFVWPAYAVTLIVLIGNVFLARASHRRAVEEALRRAARQEAGS
ncbi:MAG TPA: heme exporter protein CcmD [Steroidobacteraceae bacterium]|nr:heme exporter protein CcmD [Steroidobacteraceae bacterium]